MRIIFITAGTLFVSLMCFLTIKYWGKSQVFVDYKHPFYSELTATSEPLKFVKPSYQQLKAAIEGTENLYLDVSVTIDQIMVTPLEPLEKPIRYYKFEEIKDRVIGLEALAAHMHAERRFIFNLIENAHAMHEILMFNLKKYQLQEGKNFIFVGEYEAPIKALKELAPALLFGATKPEILKLLAMDSMGLIEALNLRADFVMHPLTIRNAPFFRETILKELRRRHKRVIVGPIEEEQVETALQLQPFGYIVKQK